MTDHQRIAAGYAFLLCSVFAPKLTAEGRWSYHGDDMRRIAHYLFKALERRGIVA